MSVIRVSETLIIDKYFDFLLSFLKRTYQQGMYQNIKQASFLKAWTNLCLVPKPK
jgi:hypothetical protein